MYEAQMKLEIVKTNISDLVEWLDENNKMDLIPDELWKYIINIEKAVGIWDEGHEEPEYDSAGFTEEDRIVDGQYMTYVANVKRSIDKATKEGVLRDDDSEGYSYLSKEEFIKRLEVDPRFVEMGDPNWLFPGEPLHDDPDQEAQDYNTFGNSKI